MAANLPSYDSRRIPVGGARLFIGAIGTTPSTDIGALDPDAGVTVTIMREYGEVRQGMPSLPILSYVSREDVEVEVSGYEINPELMRYAMGAGITTSSATEESYSLGGDPAVTTCALYVRHEMLVGFTANYYLWKAEGRSDGMQNVFNLSPTTFPMKFRALHSTTDWAGTTLNGKAQLFKVLYQKG